MNERVDIPGRTPGQAATLDRLAATTRVVLRPIGAPTALGLFGLAGGTVVFAAPNWAGFRSARATTSR